MSRSHDLGRCRFLDLQNDGFEKVCLTHAMLR